MELPAPARDVLRTIAGSELNSWIGGGNPLRISTNMVRLVEQHVGLRPDMTVLDFGCGVGRMSVGLLDRIPQGRLVGVEIVPRMIEFCRSEIATRFANAEFFCSSTRNQHYEVSMLESAVQREPEDAIFARLPQFDRILATSVFTHLDEAQSARSFARLRQQLAPDGAFVLTAFLLDPVSVAQMRAGKTHHEFGHDPTPRQAVYFGVPGDYGFVAPNERNLKRLLCDAGFAPQLVLSGAWRGLPPAARTFQDVLVCRGFSQSPPRPPKYLLRHHLRGWRIRLRTLLRG